MKKDNNYYIKTNKTSLFLIIIKCFQLRANDVVLLYRKIHYKLYNWFINEYNNNIQKYKQNPEFSMKFHLLYVNHRTYTETVPEVNTQLMLSLLFDITELYI